MNAKVRPWLLTQVLNESGWLTDNVDEAVKELMEGVPPMEEQAVIDRELLRWAARNYGPESLSDPEMLPRLREALVTTIPKRFEHVVKTLSVNGSYAHVPPVAMISHNSRKIMPSIAPIKDGRLILIDPLHHIFLTPMCCAALIIACYDLSDDELSKVVLFFVLSAAYYSPDRYVTEELLNSKTWNDLSSKLLQIDKQLAVIAEYMSFNIISFAFFHEVSHSFLGHLGKSERRDCQIGGQTKSLELLTWQQVQEIEADAEGAKYFRKMTKLPEGSDSYWTGKRFESAPLIFFRDAGNNLVNPRKMVWGDDCPAFSSPTAGPASVLESDLLPASPEGKDIYTRMQSAFKQIKEIVQILDFKSSLPPDFKLPP